MIQYTLLSERSNLKMTSSCQHQLLTFFKSLKFPLLKCVAMASPSVRFCRSRPSSQALLSASMHVRYLQTSNQVLGFFSKKKKKKTDVEKQELIIVHKSVGFQQQEIKSRENFICLIENFEASNPTRRGHVEFIYACLRNMDDFGLEKDKEIYKKIMNIFPKEKMIPKNELQIEFMHFPWQQQCAVDVLCKMEDNGVIPDKDFQYILMQTFGYRSIPIRKFYRMMYWMPKFKHASPFPLPNPVPDDTLELAVLALKRITSVDAQTNVNVYQVSDRLDS